MDMTGTPPTIGTNGIIFYGRDKCGDCVNAKDALREVGLKPGKDYQYLDVTQDAQAKADVTRICGERKVDPPRVPVLVFSPDLVFIEPQKERLVDLQMAAVAKASLYGERMN